MGSMNSTTKQLGLFTKTLIDTNNNFLAVCAVRNTYDFWAPEYTQLQNIVDTLSTQLHVLQDAVPRWWEVI